MKGRGFSVELLELDQISSLNLNELGREIMLIEGDIGDLNKFGWDDPSVLVVVGEKGVIHIDLMKDEVAKKMEESINES